MNFCTKSLRKIFPLFMEVAKNAKLALVSQEFLGT